MSCEILALPAFASSILLKSLLPGDVKYFTAAFGFDLECKEKIWLLFLPSPVNSPVAILYLVLSKLTAPSGNLVLTKPFETSKAVVGDFFIFPAGLAHWVYSFRTTGGERVSISGNINLIDGDKTLTAKNDSKEK